jgi:Uma2 family endonuclease
MRLRIGQRIRYPDVLIAAGPLGQAVETLDDALVIFEVLSDDTAAIDRVDKLIDYARVPSLRYYVMLEQTRRAAIVCQPAAGGAWTMTAQGEAAIVLADLDLALPLDDVCQGLNSTSSDA